MPAPAKPFTVIPDSKIDADSPVTEELMTFIRDNIEHLEEWLGKNFTAAVDHNHDGVNSALTSVASSIFWLNAPVTKFSGNPGASYTTISIAADTGANTAKAAILGVSVTSTGNASAGSGLSFRQTGTTGPHAIVNSYDSDSPLTSTVKVQVIVPVDDSETFQYADTTTEVTSATIALVGYII